MDVACSTLCFTKEPFERALRRIAELEFARVDLAVGTDNPHVTLADLETDSAAVIQRIKHGPSLGFAAITIRGALEDAEKSVASAAHFASQLAAPVLVIDAAPVGTSVADEVARLLKLEKAASLHGTILAVATRAGTLTEDPDVAASLCEQVRGLSLGLDPSHYTCGPCQGKSYDHLFPHVRHVHIRDTGRGKDQFQVKVGRGDIEYSRIIASLSRYQYAGALAVTIEDGLAGEDFDVPVEVRKLRLLLESLL